MNNMKKLFALLLAMAMVFCMAACAGDDNGSNDKTSTTTASKETKPQESEPNQTEPTQPNDEKPGNPDGEYVYSVTVVDIDGNPVEGAWVQICAGTTCVPKQTDADGIAYYDSEITGDGELVAKLISLPEAYSFIDLSEGREISMADGSVNVSFVLESIPGNDIDGNDYVYSVQVITVEDCGVEGVWVQICAGNTCVPKQTDKHGVAYYEEEITGDGELVAKIISIPEGYEIFDEEVEYVDGVAQITFAEDSTDVIFVLREIP